jgi:hypothetical protein
MNLLELLDDLQLHGDHLERFADLLEEAANVRIVLQFLRSLLRGQLTSRFLARQELMEDASLASVAGPLLVRGFSELLVRFGRLR